MSIASGGFFGKGPGMSTHRSNLEEAERDFAYAFIIEEYGAVGGLVVLLLYLWLFFRTIQIFKKCGTAFPSLLVLGLGLMIVLQAMIHMLVSVSLFPVTGQQLPLISKGGSSLVFTLGIGDDTRRQPTDFGKDARQPERRVAVRERDGRKATGRHSPQPIAIHSRPARKGTERTKQDKRHRQWRTAN